METITRAEKIKAGKYEDLDMEKFSISSFNSFRTNRMTWALKYLFGFKSSWPMESAWRGQAIEAAVQQSLIDKSQKRDQDYVKFAFERFQFDVLKNAVKHYEKIANEWPSTQVITEFSKAKSKEEFLKSLETIFAGHFKLNSHKTLPEFLDPEHDEFAKHLKKIAKQYLLIEEGVKLGIEYFGKIDSAKISYQRRLESTSYDLLIPTIGFTDFETSDFGLDLKSKDTSKFPKKWEKVSLNDKCQLSFYSRVTGKPWKLIITSRLGADDKKLIAILDLEKQGLSSAEIAKAYKSPDGKGTTAAFVEKTLEASKSSNFEMPSAFKEYDLPPDEVELYEVHNRVTAQAIDLIISSCRKATIAEDMKLFCYDDIEGMLVKPDEKQKIEELWGLQLDATEEEE